MRTAAGRKSEIFRDGPELLQGGSACPSGGLHRLIKTVIDVVMDQRFFGVVDRVFDRLELLCKLKAGVSFLYHFNDQVKVSVSAL